MSPASGVKPWAPRKTHSTRIVLSASMATSPTRAFDGVRSPPVMTTVGASRFSARAASAASKSTCAAGSEFVMTVRVGKCSSSVRAWASASVVVPADSARESPGRTMAAAAWPMRRLASRLRVDLAVNRGSRVVGPAATAPPWTRSTSPWVTSSVMSRRTVISEMPSSSTTSATRTPPVAATRSRMCSWRWRASIGAGRGDPTAEAEGPGCMGPVCQTSTSKTPCPHVPAQSRTGGGGGGRSTRSVGHGTLIPLVPRSRLG